MAERRMFAKTIIDNDTFLDLPATTQLLYFHLGMRADDDGFVDKPRSVMRMIGGSKNDLDLLFAQQLLIPFESGVVVIKHWKIHNYIRKDRYSETIHLEEKAALLTAENGIYTIGLLDGDQRSTNGTPMVDAGKDRLGKDSIGEDRESTADKPPTPVRKEFSRYGWVKLTQEEYDRLVADFGEAEAKRCIDYIDEAAQSTRNKNRWRDWNLVVRRCHRDGWGKNAPPQGGRGSQMPDYGGADNWSL